MGHWRWTGCSQKEAALVAQGPAEQLLCAGRKGRVADVLELLQARGGEQAGAVVGEGVEGELAVVAAHSAVVCMGTEVRARSAAAHRPAGSSGKARPF